MSSPRPSRSVKNHLKCVDILGVKVSFESPNSKLLDAAVTAVRSFFPFGTRLIGRNRSDHHLSFRRKSGVFILESEFGEQALGDDQARFFKHVRSLARIIAASNTPSLLFVHAGVVSVNGKGIMIPGDSHSGKTSLVRELVRQGATYYSDEYAVIDSRGMLIPFPKPLSIRGIDGPEVQTDVDVRSLGGCVGSTPIRVGHVVLTRYRKGARWNPAKLPLGEGLMKIIPHAIGFAKRPDFSLPYLQKALKNAIFYESDRGDVKAFSKNFLETLDK